MSLDQIEKSVSGDIAEAAASSSDEVKLALMLAMLAENAAGRLAEIDTADFPKKLAERLDKIKNENREQLRRFREHHAENRRVLRQIEAATEELPSLSATIAANLDRFDSLLRDNIEKNDALPVSKL